MRFRIVFRAKHWFAGAAGLSTAAAAEGHLWGYAAAVVSALASIDCIVHDARP